MINPAQPGFAAIEIGLHQPVFCGGQVAGGLLMRSSEFAVSGRGMLG